MSEEEVKIALEIWANYAKKERRYAREIRKYDPKCVFAAEQIGTARGILIMLRSIKSYRTQARTVNALRRQG